MQNLYTSCEANISDCLTDLHMFARNIDLKFLYKNPSDNNSMQFMRTSTFIPINNPITKVFLDMCEQDIYNAFFKGNKKSFLTWMLTKEKVYVIYA